MTRRALGLVRVSKVGGREDLLSPTLQRDAIAAHADQRGFHVVQWVEALDESGSQRRSPWWRRLDAAVEQVERGHVEAIFVWKFSRAARQRRQWAVALDRVEVAGGLLESATEQLDTTTSTGRLARGMLAELAAWEAEVKGEQWREVAANRLARGLPGDGRPRWGYTVTRDGFEVDPAAAVFVRGAYERYVAGDGFPTLTRWLDQAGQVNRNGARWTANDLRRSMDSGFAAGLLPSQVRAPVRGAHEAIVDEVLWRRYRATRTRRGDMAPRTIQAVHPLSGLVRCGTCGRTMARDTRHRTDRAGRTYHDFRCRPEDRGYLRCSGAQASELRVHQAVLDWLADIATDVDARARSLSAQRQFVSTAKREARAAAARVEKIDEALARMVVQQAMGEIPPEAYRLARDRMTAERDALAEAARLAQDDAERTMPRPTVVRSLLGSWDELVERDPAGLREVLAALITEVVVTKGDPLSGIAVIPRWSRYGV